ncbi:hypothetical protein OE88DRAFT_831138 [Heliocybe sulcata]|uniref:Secreted protein n=1 Tax=Heliocybe sulcata TaxID=5364 RepID=A0A5C3MQY5_9AGAM|nr:hypothetical protein OE88DRAFT_831138 [Heliocybe sulcata]
MKTKRRFLSLLRFKLRSLLLFWPSSVILEEPVQVATIAADEPVSARITISEGITLATRRKSNRPDAHTVNRLSTTSPTHSHCLARSRLHLVTGTPAGTLLLSRRLHRLSSGRLSLSDGTALWVVLRPGRGRLARRMSPGGVDVSRRTIDENETQDKNKKTKSHFDSRVSVVLDARRVFLFTFIARRSFPLESLFIFSLDLSFPVGAHSSSTHCLCSFRRWSNRLCAVCSSAMRPPYLPSRCPLLPCPSATMQRPFLYEVEESPSTLYPSTVAHQAARPQRPSELASRSAQSAIHGQPG